MDGTGEHHLERDSPSSEDQKSYVLPHMRTSDVGQMQQCCWTWVVAKGRAYTGGMGKVG
jgi:hypothetical protein